MSPSKTRPGLRVARARQRAELSQEQLAARVGTNRVTIARIEIGARGPSLGLALALSRELGESVERLFGGGR